LKVKEATCIETQRLIGKTDYLRYVVELRVKTPDVPYGDTFDCVTRYCITWKSAKECRITCGTDVDFVKSTMMKGMIRGAASKGTSESAHLFLATLKEVLSGKSKKKVETVQVVREEGEPHPPAQVEKSLYNPTLIILTIILLLNVTLYIAIRSTNHGLTRVADNCIAGLRKQ